MSREHRYKAWDKSCKKMGAVTQLTGEVGIFPKWVRIVYNDGSLGRTMPIGHITLREFTGRLDTNGKEVCAGDVLKYTRYNWKCHGHPKHQTNNVLLYRVFWDEEECAFRAITEFEGGGATSGGLRFNDSRADKNEIEIIGNIYENPELLK